MTEETTSPNESPADRRTAVRDRYGAIAHDEGAETTDDDCCEPTCCGDDGSNEADGRSNDADDGSNEADEPEEADRSDGTDRPNAAEACCDDGSDEESETSSCCGTLESDAPDARSLELGYEESDLERAPDGTNLGLGCGNPVALSNLEAGETVLDLGSGGGFDCFLAAREVGPEGRAIGVDMTPEMVERARENAAESDLENVEFRLGEIEHLPVADGIVDAVLSNCVINLSAAKPRAFAEAFRVLRPGGRLAISDLVATDPLPAAVRENPDLVTACVGGAATVDDLEAWLADAGFEDVSIAVEGDWDAEYGGDPLPVVSARIEATKPT